ncbi:MAG: FAD-binding oxidoreductase, partial [Alphaproteobacteria bacterium]
MADSPSLLPTLASLLGPTGLLTEASDLAPALADWRSLYEGRAMALLRPANTAELAEAVRLCSAAGIAIVPQGGNTSMVGGATPDASGRAVIVSLARMNRIRD